MGSEISQRNTRFERYFCGIPMDKEGALWQTFRLTTASLEF